MEPQGPRGADRAGAGVQVFKDEILELYLNKVYFGGGAYGVDAAARKFFGHEGRQLSLGESAIIAGLVKAPSHYSPPPTSRPPSTAPRSCWRSWSMQAPLRLRRPKVLICRR
jgi:membrane carboxypeptidase/penicillin-binding protein PbpC